MRRTLIAVGIAVLVSMLFGPHKEYWRFMERNTRTPTWNPFILLPT
jgi:hypothetical protein